MRHKALYLIVRIIGMAAAVVAVTVLAHAEQHPLQLHPQNSHYFVFRGKPTVLIGSSEHYGAIMNRDFNYVRYLDTLKANNLNVTRVFSGQYRERVGKFGTLPKFSSSASDFEIVQNTLAPNANAFVAPWPRSDQPGALDGRNRFNLSRWNTEYFERLTDFVRQADLRGIVVEISLFSPYYVNAVGNHFWEISPWNARNNINGIGDIDGNDALSLKDERLVSVQEAMVRKILTELRGFDNVYYEICNEPYLTDVPLDWQAHIASVIAQTEATLGTRHLIMQEFSEPRAPESAKIANPQWRQGVQANGTEKRLPGAWMLAFHTAEPRVVIDNYKTGLPIGQNESVFLLDDAANRVSAWRILMAGGAFHHGTDYSFTRGHEDGSFVVPVGGAGGGGPQLRRQLSILHSFLDGLDFIGMKPSPQTIRSGVGEGSLALVLADDGGSYAIYISHERTNPSTGTREIDGRPQQLVLTLNIPDGAYKVRWISTRIGTTVKQEALSGGPSAHPFNSPEYSEDIALIVSKASTH